MEGTFDCTVCCNKSTHTYEGYPVCNNMECEFEIQVALDYTEEAGDR